MAENARRVSVQDDSSSQNTEASENELLELSEVSQESSFDERVHKSVKSTLHQNISGIETTEGSSQDSLSDINKTAVTDDDDDVAIGEVDDNEDDDGDDDDDVDDILDDHDEDVHDDVDGDDANDVDADENDVDVYDIKVEEEEDQEEDQNASTNTDVEAPFSEESIIDTVHDKSTTESESSNSEGDNDEEMRRKLLIAHSQKTVSKQNDTGKKRDGDRRKKTASESDRERKRRKKSHEQDIQESKLTRKEKMLKVAHKKKLAQKKESRSDEKNTDPKKSRVHRRFRSSSESDDDSLGRKRYKDRPLNKEIEKERRRPSPQKSRHLQTPHNRCITPNRSPSKQHLSREDRRLNTSRDTDSPLNGSISSLAGYTSSPATTPAGRDNKAGWYDIHEKHVKMAGYLKAEVVLCGDSIIAGLARYAQVWSKYFRPLKALNMGIGGDRTQHVLWRAEHFDLPHTTKVIILHCGTNNIDRDSPRDIAFGVASIGLSFQERSPGLKIIITGLLPRDPYESFRRRKIRKVNLYLKYLCKEKLKDFYYMKHGPGWILENDVLNNDLYYTDNLHLIETGNDKFAKEIIQVYYKVLEDKLEYSDDEQVVDMTKNDNEQNEGEIISGRFNFQRKYGGERRSRKRSISPVYNRRSSPGSRKRRRSNSDNDESSRKKHHSPYKVSKTDDDNHTPSRWSNARKLGKLIKDDSEFKRIDKDTLQNKLTKALKDYKTDEKIEGTAKSIDISLNEAKRIAARKAKFGLMNNPKTTPTKVDLEKLSELSKAEINQPKESKPRKPSDLIRRIHKSQQNARYEIKNKKLAVRRNSLVAYSRDSPSQSSPDEEEAKLKSKEKNTKKLLSDYASNSEAESD